MPFAVDPHAPHWFAHWLRRAFLERGLIAVSTDPQHRDALDAWLSAPTDDATVGTRGLLAWLATLAEGRLAADADVRSARAAALRFARCLAWISGLDEAADAIAAAQRRHQQGLVESGPSRRPLDAATDAIGRALCSRIADGVDGWLAAATLAVVSGCDRRAVALLWGHAAPQVSPAASAIDGILGSARYEQTTVLEAVVGLVRADEVVDGREQRLLDAAIRAAAVDTGGAKLLRRMVRQGGADLDGLASALPDRIGQRRLLQLLELAAVADGHADPTESAWIDAVADALAAPPALRLEAHATVAARLAHGSELADALGRVPLGDATSRRAERQIRALVARHLRAIATELHETGDLMVLLAASTTRQLDPEEQRQMRAQLLDVCRAVPALAIFAAPGGTLLLPILARVLPFSLAPSSFRDDGI